MQNTLNKRVSFFCLYHMCNLMLLIVEREIGEKMDKLVQERVAEYLKTHIPQATSNRGPPQHQPHHGSQLLHTGLPISPRNPPSALQGPSSPTLYHTIASPLDLTHPSALAHSSKNLSLTLPPPTSSTRSISDVGSRRFIPQTAAKLTIKKADGTEVSLENITKITPTMPAISSPQSLVFRQGSSGSPNRSLHMETEDQHKSRLAELKQNDRQKAEAADKEKKEKEKVEAERKAKVTDEIHKLEKAARLEKEQKGERLRKEAEALELQGLKEEEEEEERRLNLKQERTKVEKGRKEKEKEEREEQERLSKLAEETQLRLGDETAAKARVEAISEPELEEREEAELEAHKGDGKDERQLEDGKDVDAESPKSFEDRKDRKDKPKDGLRINTTSSIISPTSDKRRLGPLDLSGATGAIRSASPVVAALATARVIADIATVPYPEGYHSPHPDLNQNVKNGKFRYH